MQPLRKVAVVTPGAFVIPSGRSSSVERVIEKMVPLAADRLDVRIYGVMSSGTAEQGRIGSVPCIRVPGGSAYMPSIIRHLHAWGPDAIDVHNRPALACGIKRKLPQASLYLSLHSTTFIREGDSSVPGEREELGGLDGIIVNSRYLRDELHRRYPGLQLPVAVNHLGVRPEDFNPRWTPLGEALRRSRLAEFGWEGRKIVLFVGRLLPEKGVHELLKAVPEVISRMPEALFLIVGSPYYSRNRDTGYVRRLRQMAAPWRDHIVFQPFTPYPHVADWYNLADVTIVPSGEDEAFGLVNVEAMASGVPVIATHAGGIPEIVENNVSGILLAPGRVSEDMPSAITNLLQNEHLQRTMGIAGLEAVRSRFRWQHTADRWASFMLTGQMKN